MAASYHELSVVAFTEERFGDSEDWCRKSLVIKEKLGHRPGMAITYHQLGRIAYVRGRLDESEDWCRKALVIAQETGNRRLMVVIFLQLGMTAEAQERNALALEWYIRCATVFDEFPDPLARSGPAGVARLTRQLGLPALEQAWQQVTGQPVPQPVRDYIANYRDERTEGEA